MPAFWEHTALAAITLEQWESLCDGCAKCCLHKLEDRRTREITYTNVACRLLNHTTGQCSDYAHRAERVPSCVAVTAALLEDPYWLPRTCAYRLLAEGRPLPVWHPLRSGAAQSVARAGHSVCGRIICETQADDLELHLIEWVR